MAVHVVDHPLVRHKLGILRKESTSTSEFRMLAKEIARLVPGAKISVVGLYRNEETLEPVEYYVKLAKEIDQRIAIILDPMLATGGSLIATIDLLKKRGCKRILSLNLVCAPEGIKRVEEAHPDVDIYTAAVDSHLDEHGYIIPGLGDAGDRIFGTR